jgi:hypothetical protein
MIDHLGYLVHSVITDHARNLLNSMKTIRNRWLLSIGVGPLVALTACGSSSGAAKPTQTATPKPDVTFQTIKVTAIPEDTPTPIPTLVSEASTKGVPREFPKNLKIPMASRSVH